MEKILQLSGYKTVTVDNLFAVAVWWHFFSTCTPRKKNPNHHIYFFGVVLTKSDLNRKFQLNLLDGMKCILLQDE